MELDDDDDMVVGLVLLDYSQKKTWQPACAEAKTQNMLLRSGLRLLKKGRRRSEDSLELELKPVDQQALFLADEFFGGDLSDATLSDLPRLVLKGILYLQTEREAKQLTGAQKKECLIKVLQDICPHDLLDQFIPPLVDLVCQLLKEQKQRYRQQEEEEEEEEGEERARRRWCPLFF